MSAATAAESKERIQSALGAFATQPLPVAARALFGVLGYVSSRDERVLPIASPEAFLDWLEVGGRLARLSAGEQVEFRASLSRLHFLFQLTDAEIKAALSQAVQNQLFDSGVTVDGARMESYLVFAAELAADVPVTRTALARLARLLNKPLPMPALVLFRHGATLTLGATKRRLNLRDAARDVLERVTLIKDIRFASPHRAHVEILFDLSLYALYAQYQPASFVKLHEAWQKTLDIQTLNRRFYTELAWWYFWAVKQVRFPKGGGADANKRHAVAVIRLLTRLIFVWFIKEKGLIPPELFDRARLRELLKTDPTANPEAGNYYLAILQNLFFATLNVEMGADEQGNRRRRWASENKRGGQSGHYLISSVYRHKELFKDPDATLALFSTIPFLNGGLFECLDRELTEPDVQRNPELKPLASKEGSGWVLRVDGFSRRKEAQAIVPNQLFFGSATADLNADLGTKGKRYEVRGLIDLFDRYKFTVDENTPVEEEVALDPELLGKVFENLLASYNEDTQTTARKQSGSFYTPREVVDYMVDEALIAYFERHLLSAFPPMMEKTGLRKGRPVNEVLELDAVPGELDLSRSEPADEATGQAGDAAAARESPLVARLRRLLSYAEPGHDFGEAEKAVLIAAIESLKVLDPACGSGAFPMGVLHKLVHVLKKLDPDNTLWRQQNRAPLAAQLAEARKIPDLALREEKVEAAEAALEKFDRDFSSANHADYTRKLYLIEKCIHGVDIQPIAVQIAKLRFFVALIVSQKVDATQHNHNVTALPNLETKIVAADSLVPIDRPAQGGLRDPAIDEKQQALISANESYFAARTGRTKRKWRDRIFTLRDELAALLEQDRFLPEGAAKQLVHWNPFDQNAAADFFDPEWMFQLADGFDVVIGNPPYVRQEKIKDLKPLFKKNYQCFTGVADLYVYFYERSIKLLKPEGIFAFITSNKWYRANYGENLREWMNRNTRILRIIDFGDADVFAAIAYPTIVIAQRRKLPSPACGRGVGGEGEMIQVLNWTQEHPVEIFPAVFAAENFPVPQTELKKEGWQLEPPVKRRLLERIRAAGKPLGEYVQGRFYRGILTGLNEAFVIDGATRARLIAEDPKSAEIIKPFLRGRDVKRWRVEFADQYLIKIESSENKKHPWSDNKPAEAETVFAKTYPAIYKHFQNYQQALVDRYDQGRFFWELRGCVYWQEFEKPKIIYPDIYLHQSFAWDIHHYYLANTGYFIPTDEKYLAGLLNSIAIEWFYEQLANRIQGGYLRSFSDYMRQVRIPSTSNHQKTLIESIVTAILAPITLTPDPSPASGRGEWERLINGLVYELFFPDDLHQVNIRLFDAAAKAGLDRLTTLDGSALADAASELATVIFAPSHPIQEMLADLQRLEVVRVIEGRD